MYIIPIINRAEFRDAVLRIGFGPLGDNHHNAALCPYCTPRGYLDGPPHGTDTLVPSRI